MAISSFGIDLQIGDGATPTEAFTSIAEVKDFDGPTLTKDMQETTPHSPSGHKWRRFISGLRNGGEVTFAINYETDEPTHNATAGLLSELDSDDMRNWKVIFPGAGAAATRTWSFSGTVTAFGPSNPVEGVQTASVSIKVDGQPTLV